MYWLPAKFEGKCNECGDPISVGDKIYFNGKSYCEICGPREEETDKKKLA